MPNMIKLQQEVMDDLKRQADEIKYQPKEIIMNTTHRVVGMVAEKVTGAIETGKQFAKNPRSLGVYVADDINNTEEMLRNGINNVKMSFVHLKDSIKEIREGYKETRK